ncbi:ATP-binding protein [Streptomyces canus]|uniref:sensor histidine kinase n=1 Tax=Streptomyces canus TaxID=58343 RepID=UPI0033F560E3
MSLIHDVLLWTPYVPLTAAGGAALHYRARRKAADKRAADAERRAAEAARLIAARDEEARQFADSRLPALAYALQHGTPPSFGGLLHPELNSTIMAAAYESALKQVGALMGDASRKAEEATRATVRACVKSVQALLYEQQTAISNLLDSEDDERVLALVQPIDHAGNQLLRRLQVLGVIAGTWPGRQRDNVPLNDAIRGAMSRIRDYQRVRPPRASGLYLADRNVEPVVLVLAELLDNAARHSPPSTPVDVRLIEGAQGVSIEIHDAGAGMSAEAELEAKRRLSGDGSFRLTELRNPPSFGHLGAGVLARRYGFRVYLDDASHYGGVRAVVFLPQALLAEAPPPEETAPAPVQQTASAAPVRQSAPSEVAAAGPYEITHDGLAKRNSGRPASQDTARPRRPLAGGEPPPSGSGRGLAAFVQATRGIHADAPQISNPSPTSEESPR